MGKFQTKKGEFFEAECRKYMKLRHINTLEKLRSHTTVGSNTTFLKYFDDPDTMPMGKMAEIMSALNMPKDVKSTIINRIIEGD